MPCCAYCCQPAVVTITARGHGEITYRAVTSCATHRQQARTWASRAGPLHETPVDDHQEPTRLF